MLLPVRHLVNHRHSDLNKCPGVDLRHLIYIKKSSSDSEVPLGLETVPQISHKARTTARGLDQGSCAVEERHVSGKCTPSLHPHAFLQLSSCTSTLVTPAHCACGLGTGNLSSLLLHWLICCLLGAPWPPAGPAGRVKAP